MLDMKKWEIALVAVGAVLAVLIGFCLLGWYMNKRFFKINLLEKVRGLLPNKVKNFRIGKNKVEPIIDQANNEEVVTENENKTVTNEVQPSHQEVTRRMLDGIERRVDKLQVNSDNYHDLLKQKNAEDAERLLETADKLDLSQKTQIQDLKDQVVVIDQQIKETDQKIEVNENRNDNNQKKNEEIIQKTSGIREEVHGANKALNNVLFAANSNDKTFL